MGKNSRERKLLKLEAEAAEKMAIEQRRRDRLTPIFRLVRRLTIMIVITIALLWFGAVVTNHLPGITGRILRGQF